jgi:Uma2 family endonuclease
MEKRITVAEYLGMPEANKPQELAYGILREPPAPRYGHQAVVTRMTAILAQFVERAKLGVVCVSPIDVVLDRERALVVQPDIVFVSAERADIIRGQIWGAPDLVVEVLSPRTAKRDRTRKLEWYGEYGVKECWLVDDRAREVTVIRLDAGKQPRVRTYRARQRLYSRVLRGFRSSIARLLGTTA